VRQFLKCVACGCAAAAILTLSPTPALLAQTPVTIKIKTQPATVIAAGFSGFNTPQPRNGVEYFDPKFITAITPLRAGFVRYPGGTVSLPFDWTTGHTNMDWMNSLITGNPPPVSGQSANILTTAQQLTQAKGGVLFSDFATFAQTLGTPVVICFNSYTDTNPGSATEMAQTAQSYGLNVTEWELGNEAYLYPLIYPTPAAYSAASNSYYNDIVAGTPGATVGLFAAGSYPGIAGNYASWDQGLWQTSTPPYWNAASNHIYPIVNIMNAEDTMWALNGILAHGSSDYVTSYLAPLVGPNTPIFITEFNCCSAYSNKFLSYIYNGIFLAEYIARMSAVPNVKGVGINSIYTDNADYHGMIQSVDDYESYLLAQVAANPNYYTNTATDPNTQFQFYTSAPGLAMQLANRAINSGTHIWPTTVSGGPTVKITGFDGNPIPAIYAQAYLASSGGHYLLITNKSAAAQTVTIELNGAPLTGTFNIAYISNSNPAASNTSQAQTNVQIQKATSGNPISVGGYSVTTVQW
jgi:hypothetical protein